MKISGTWTIGKVHNKLYFHKNTFNIISNKGCWVLVGPVEVILGGGLLIG